MALVVKNLPVNAEDIRDIGLIPGSGRSPGGRHGTHFRHTTEATSMHTVLREDSRCFSHISI